MRVLCLLLGVAAATQVVTVDFSNLTVFNTTLGLQVVVNPVLEAATCGDKSAAAFALLKELCDAGADLIRWGKLHEMRGA